MGKVSQSPIVPEFKISVRNLVEFILATGNIDNRRHGSFADQDAMLKGGKIHRKIQKKMGLEYQSEVSLNRVELIQESDFSIKISVEGRADGIITKDTGVTIDEIKSTYLELQWLKEPIPMHCYQAMCYAYIYGKELDLEQIEIRLTYCHIETEEIKYFTQQHSLIELEKWYQNLIQEYSKWVVWQYKWLQQRNCSIKRLEFPFPYRSGQKEFVTGVYKTILRSKRLYVQAPTGVGKTISTVFPSVKAMGEGIVSKIFYLTAKTIARTVAEDTFQLLVKHNINIKTITITAKDKICVLEKSDCNPVACSRAKGHYDRVNQAVFDILMNENDIDREKIEIYAKKHQVCPYEMCLDISNWVDVVICDYNYAFDPTVYLRRFFQLEKKQDYVFLIDEAHNLVERAREMFSAVLIKEQFLNINTLLQGKSKKLSEKLMLCNDDFLQLKRECDEFCVIDNIEKLILHLLRLTTEYEEFFQLGTIIEGREEILALYLEVRHFLAIYEKLNEKYVIYTDYTEKGEFRIKLQCMDPSTNLSYRLEKVRSAIFFSATLLPIRYYKEQLAGEEDDYAIYAPSSFDEKNRILLIANDVTTRYKRRTPNEYVKILTYIFVVANAKKGNYMVFFPSYQMMHEVIQYLEEETWLEKFHNMTFVIQKNSMSEQDKEEFLKEFTEDVEKTKIGFCVLGGVFSEGIDLKAERLIGVIIVGTGLPMLCNERELFRNYFQEKKNAGFEYAYLYQGMNKVLQSAGRVIRTDTDIGVIVLLDDRFLRTEYQNLFPREWFPNDIVHKNSISKKLEGFWREQERKQ